MQVHFTTAVQFYVHIKVELYVHAFLHLYGGEKQLYCQICYASESSQKRRRSKELSNNISDRSEA